MVKELIICRGIPGSGKTTYAKEWAKCDSSNRIRLNLDDLRNMLGEYWVTKREPVVKAMLMAGLNEAAYCENPYHIIIDATNFNPRTIKEFEDWIQTFNNSFFSKENDVKYEIIYKDFPTPLEVCIERDSKRERPIGEEVIRNMYNKYKDIIYK